MVDEMRRAALAPRNHGKRNMFTHGASPYTAHRDGREHFGRLLESRSFLLEKRKAADVSFTDSFLK